MSDLSNHMYLHFLKAHDPHYPLTLGASEMTKTMTNTHTKIHKFEVLERPIMCYIYEKQLDQGYLV